MPMPTLDPTSVVSRRNDWLAMVIGVAIKAGVRGPGVYEIDRSGRSTAALGRVAEVEAGQAVVHKTRAEPRPELAEVMAVS